MTKKKTRKTSHKKSTKNKRLHVINHSKNNIKITIGDRKKNTSQKKNITQPRPTSNVIVTMPPQYPYFQMPQQYVNPFNQQQQTVNTPQPPITSNPSLIATVTAGAGSVHNSVGGAQNTAGSVHNSVGAAQNTAGSVHNSVGGEVGSIGTNQSHQNIQVDRFLSGAFDDTGSRQDYMRYIVENEKRNREAAVHNRSRAVSDVTNPPGIQTPIEKDEIKSESGNLIIDESKIAESNLFNKKIEESMMKNMKESAQSSVHSSDYDTPFKRSPLRDDAVDQMQSSDSSIVSKASQKSEPIKSDSKPESSIMKNLRDALITVGEKTKEIDPNKGLEENLKVLGISPIKQSDDEIKQTEEEKDEMKEIPPDVIELSNSLEISPNVVIKKYSIDIDNDIRNVKKREAKMTIDDFRKYNGEWIEAWGKTNSKDLLKDLVVLVKNKKWLQNIPFVTKEKKVVENIFLKCLHNLIHHNDPKPLIGKKRIKNEIIYEEYLPSRKRKNKPPQEGVDQK